MAVYLSVGFRLYFFLRIFNHLTPRPPFKHPLQTSCIMNKLIFYNEKTVY